MNSEKKPSKMRLTRVELISKVTVDGLSVDILLPGDSQTGGLEITPLAEAAGLEGQHFPGYRVRSPRTGNETHLYPANIKAVLFVPER